MTAIKRLIPQRDEGGQSLVEFCLSVSVLILIAVGVLDLGRLYMTYLAVQNAAAEGALYGSIHPFWIDSCEIGFPGCWNQAYDNVLARTRNEAPAGGLINWDMETTQIIVEYVNGAPYTGDPIRVTVEYEYRLFTPILSNIWPTLTLRGIGTQRILDGWIR
jgi:hypothetical protein